MNKTLVSVLMTVFNHERFVHKAIKSIINQSYKNLELIVIDNGSHDKSKNIINKIKDKRIKKIFLKKNIGRTNCLNYGLNFCKGEYIAILDSDDIAKKNRIKDQIKEFEKNKNIWLLGSDYEIIKKNKKKSFNQNSIIFNKNPRKILFENLISHSSVMYKKKLINKIGKYPTNFKYAQDYAFYLKAFKRFKIKILNKKLIKYRAEHEYSETHRRSSQKIITKEKIRLLLWSYKNFELSLNEIFIFLIILVKQYIKLIK